MLVKDVKTNLHIRFGKQDAGKPQVGLKEVHLPHSSNGERRRWQRLSVPVPMFIRGVDDRGKEFLEFSTALNISAGGALLVSRRFLPDDAKILLEIPPAPFPKTKSKAHNIKARVVQVRNSERYHLCSLEFAKPLTNS